VSAYFDLLPSLEPLNDRDARAGDLLSAFEF